MSFNCVYKEVLEALTDGSNRDRKGINQPCILPWLAIEFSVTLCFVITDCVTRKVTIGKKELNVGKMFYECRGLGNFLQRSIHV